MKRIIKDFAIAYNKTLFNLKRRPYVDAILLTGSYNIGGFSKYSDIDFQVIVNSQYRWKEYRLINGVEVEIFFNPSKQIELDFANEFKKPLEPMKTIHMFSHGKILVDNSGNLKKLTLKAKSLWLKKVKFSKLSLHFIKYHIHDNEKDIDDAINKKDTVLAEYLMIRLFDILIRAFFAGNKKKLVKEKILLHQLSLLDKEYFELCKNFLLEKNVKKRRFLLSKISDKTFDLLGGKFSENHKTDKTTVQFI